MSAATNAIRTAERAAPPQAQAHARSRLSVRAHDLAGGLPHLERVLDLGRSSLSNDPDWLRHWAAAVNGDILIVTAESAGQPVAAIAIETVRMAGRRIGRFVGGRHANGNFPALARALDADEAAALRDGLGDACAAHGIDMLALERQLEQMDGLANPLLASGSSRSPNVALSVDLDGGFEAVLERHSGKRKRKRHRSAQRKFEAAGDFAVVDPVAPEDSSRALDAYFDMKSVQFQKRGMADAFGHPGERAFFKALAAASSPADRHHVHLSVLMAGGQCRAVMGSSVSGGVQSVHFMAYADDELAQASPGDFLNHALLERACARGLTTYDLGVGDEPYKRSWCDHEIWQRDVIVGLSASGRLLAVQWHAVAALKGWVKRQAPLWTMIKAARRRIVGGAPEKAASQAREDGADA